MRSCGRPGRRRRFELPDASASGRRTVAPIVRWGTTRHALAVDHTGDRLAFGSTTGGLWIGEDQGDHWRELSHTLPPIHAVRFVA
jgi:hypothetical protein